MLKLRSKIVMAFSFIIIIGTILMVSTINYSTRAGYKEYTRNSDKMYTQRLLPILVEYFQTYNKWDDIDKILILPKSRMGDMMMGGKGRNFVPEIVIADINGKIVNSSYKGDKKRLNKDQLAMGVPIKVNGKTAGFILTGSMISPTLSAEEEYFLNRIKVIIILITAFTLFTSIIFSYIFSYKLTKPITALSKATKQIENGNYSIRVNEKGTDEISTLSKSFNNMASSIQHNDTWRKQIIADSAHELRTPVTLIQGQLEMIIDGVYNADKKNLKSIYEETLILSRLIKELQELSSAESGNLNLIPTKIELKEFIDSIIKSYTSGTLIENIELKSTITNPLPLIYGDTQKLTQVFNNIISNAIRYTNKYIQIDSEVNKEYVIIKISDNGIGIPKDDLEKVFERFYRVDRSRNREQGGSGLGLAISKSIITAHKGKIYAESNIHGTTIVIKLPIIQ